MSGRRKRVSKGVTNAGVGLALVARPGTASAQLTARLSNRGGGTALLSSSSTPFLARATSSSNQQRGSGSTNQLDGRMPSREGDNPLPPLDWAGSVPPRPNTTAGAFGRPSSQAESPNGAPGQSGPRSTPPRSSPGLSRRDAALANSNGIATPGPAKPHPNNTATNYEPASANQRTAVPRVGRDGGTGGESPVEDPMADGGEGIPLGLHKLDREDLEVYVNVVRATLARKAQRDQGSFVDATNEAPKSTLSELSAELDSGGGPLRVVGRANGGNIDGRSGVGRVRNRWKTPKQIAKTVGGGDGEKNRDTVDVPAADGPLPNADAIKDKDQQQGHGQRRRHKQRLRSKHHHHHHHHHYHMQQQRRGKGGTNIGESTVPHSSSVASSSNKGWGNHSNDDSLGEDRSWFSRSKSSKSLPLRTLMLDSEVNNIPHVNTQSDFQALIKAQNIPHPSYDIDGDGVVSQEDYALAKRFDINGDGVLDEAEKVVGRRIMTEMFLEKHRHDLHLYGQGLARKSMAANVEDISRSRGFKKIISGLREKEKNFVNHGSDGVRECVTLKPHSLTRHNFFANKFDTTAWNDFTRDPRDADWLDRREHDGSRNQMYFMRKVEARESAQRKLNASYCGDGTTSTRRITLITNPAIENA